MWRTYLWSHGRLWAAIQLGVPAGVFFGLFEYGTGETASRAISGGLFFGALFGPFMAWTMWRSWPGAKQLTGAERLTVAKAARRGEGTGDPRLAPVLLGYCASVREQQKPQRRDLVILVFFAAGTLGIAVAESNNASTASAVTWWLLFVLWLVLLVRVPRQRARVLTGVSRAEAAARRQLEANHPEATHD